MKNQAALRELDEPAMTFIKICGITSPEDEHSQLLTQARTL